VAYCIFKRWFSQHNQLYQSPWLRNYVLLLKTNMEKKMFYNYLLSVCAVVAALFPGSAWSQTTYHFASIASLADQEIAAKMLIPTLKNGGIDIDVEPMPGERARVEATIGRKDGDLGRIFSYGEHNPTMIRVPTPYATNDLVAFALKSKNISVKSKADLAKYKLAIIRGVQVTRDITKGMPNVHEVNELEAAIEAVQAGRDDIFVTSEFAALYMLKKRNITDIVPVGNISSLPLYIYLNPRHKDVAARFDAIIAASVKTGELKRLREKYKKEYLDAIK
jgi:polar amino acid transport system substrate-binding protein